MNQCANCKNNCLEDDHENGVGPCMVDGCNCPEFVPFETQSLTEILDEIDEEENRMLATEQEAEEDYGFDDNDKYHNP